MKPRIYKYDNVKALLIFLVVVGHLTTDYVSVSHSIRWFTLWIYSFHMPAFIFVSGLMHKHYITEDQAANGIKGNTKIRWDKIIGFILCGYGLKFFIHIVRTLIGQHPNFYWFTEPGIPWYLFVLAMYELLLYLFRKVDWKIMLIGSFALSAIIGYFPAVGDVLSLSRMINFYPIFLLGYYVDAGKLIEFSEQRKAKIAAWIVVAASLLICYLGPWNMYAMRKWFTGRRSYEFLSTYFGNITATAWAIRIGIWAIALLISLAVIIVIPNREMGIISKIGANTLNIYFWHRPICYWINGLGLFPLLVNICGDSDALATVLFTVFALALTVLFGQDIFQHPAKDLTKLVENFMNKQALKKQER